MPVMSRIERGFCRGALWRSGTGAVTRTLPLELLGDRVLEIGSGAGHVAESLVRHHPGMTVTATDLDPAMLTAATRRLADRPGVTVRPADATALPFADGTFDSVLSCLMLHHVIDWESALGEASRVLRPGGVLVGYDLTRTALATALHTMDRSPFRLFTAREFADGCGRAGLIPDLEIGMRGHIVRFRARSAA